MINASVDLGDLERFFDALPANMQNEVSQVMREQMEQTEEYARNNHRFETQTGTLESAISSVTDEISGELFVDENVAPYGKYVHDGQRSWAPDQFITQAVEARLDEIVEAVDNAIQDAIDRSD
jgi:hypothetical protein